MRRTMTGFGGAAVLALSLMAQALPAAAAELEWCSEDPIITVNGTVLNMETKMQTAAANVVGVAYVVTVPKGADVTVDNSNQAIPATVQIRYAGEENVRTQVTVTSAKSFAIVVTIVGGERPTVRTGVSNRMVRLSTQLPHERSTHAD